MWLVHSLSINNVLGILLFGNWQVMNKCLSNFWPSSETFDWCWNSFVAGFFFILQNFHYVQPYCRYCSDILVYFWTNNPFLHEWSFCSENRLEKNPSFDCNLVCLCSLKNPFYHFDSLVWSILYRSDMHPQMLHHSSEWPSVLVHVTCLLVMWSLCFQNHRFLQLMKVFLQTSGALGPRFLQKLFRLKMIPLTVWFGWHNP